MRRLLIALMFLGFLAVLPASAADPYVSNRCSTYLSSISSGSSITCNMQGTTSGRKIVIGGYALGTAVTITGTETFTCPAASQNVHNYGGTSWVIFECYVDTASSHSVFATTMQVTCGTCGSGLLHTFEVDGLSSGDDTGARTATNAASTSYTTAGSNEWVFVTGVDQALSLIVGTGFAQIHQSSGIAYHDNIAGARLLSQSILKSGAGTYTADFTDSSSSGTPLIAVMAFTNAGTAVRPTPYIVQGCNMFNPNFNIGQASCPLNNVTAGSDIVIGFQTSFATAAGNCFQICNCPASAQAGNGIDFAIGVCYLDNANAASLFYAGTTGANAYGSENVYEVGALGSLDTGSEAAANGTNTVNFTTANNNEWAFMVGGDVLPGGTITPGNSFIYMNTVFGTVQGTLTAYRSLATSGSYTASYTATGTDARPGIAVMAFTFTPTVTGIRHRAVEY
jgi:hypothetical protein